MPNNEPHLDVEVTFFTSDRTNEISALQNQEPAAQRAVVVNYGFRPYNYRIWTSVDGDALSYPESTPTDVATFKGSVGFPRRGTQPPVERGGSHFEAVRYSAGTRTQPANLQIAKTLNVGDETEGGWSRVSLGPHYIECNP